MRLRTIAPCKSGCRSDRKRRQAGSEIVEFGLLLLPFLALVFLILNVAWIFFGWACLQEGVREGVRFGVTGELLPPNTGLNSSISNVVQQYSFGFLRAANSPVIDIQYYSPTTMQPLSGSGATDAGNVIRVTASIKLMSLAPLPGSHGGFTTSPITLTASSSDVMEGSPGGIAPPEYP
jgi:Flp pilus assembly protein TadG